MGHLWSLLRNKTFSRSKMKLSKAILIKVMKMAHMMRRSQMVRSQNIGKIQTRRPMNKKKHQNYIKNNNLNVLDSNLLFLLLNQYKSQ